LFVGGDGTFGAGDIIVIGWNHGTGAVTGPTLLYDASANGDEPATMVSWR
jgi:predicted aconitase with swiveling domain